MNTQKQNFNIGVVTAIILVAAFSRVIPHMPNFSPLGAIGLFGAAHFQKKWLAFAMPLVATWLSDLFLNNVIYSKYNPEFTWFSDGFYWQYGAYILIVLVGLVLIKKVNVKTILAGSLASTAIFFIVSNFGCWPGNFYPQNFNGLMQCYVAGIPFLGGTFLGDLFYNGVLFVGFYLLQKRFSIFKMPHLKYA